jgi:hypothetical protein
LQRTKILLLENKINGLDKTLKTTDYTVEELNFSLLILITPISYTKNKKCGKRKFPFATFNE